MRVEVAQQLEMISQWISYSNVYIKPFIKKKEIIDVAPCQNVV